MIHVFDSPFELVSQESSELISTQTSGGCSCRNDNSEFGSVSGPAHPTRLRSFGSERKSQEYQWLYAEKQNKRGELGPFCWGIFECCQLKKKKPVGLGGALSLEGC